MNGGAKEQKHMAIVGSIERLESRVNSLENLLRTIGGTPSDEPEKPVEVNPCLREFLDRSTDELNTLSDRLVKVIEGLNESLF